MATRVRLGSVDVVNIPVSELSERPAQLFQELGPGAEALVTRNKETLGVMMTVERRNALADTEERLAEALLRIDMLSAGRTFENLDDSAREVVHRKGMPLTAYRAKLRKQVGKP